MNAGSRALGGSGQSFYNRFGSKGALADWAVQALVDRSLAEALCAIEQPARTLPDRLADALDAWVGRHRDALHAPPTGVDIGAAMQTRSSGAVRPAERQTGRALGRERVGQLG